MAGCASSYSTASGLKSGDYSAVLPYQTSDTRGKHVGLIADMDIRVQLESGLMELSKEYFPPAEMAYKTHAFLDYDELDATDGSRGLLGTLRDGNPNALNPGRDEVFDTGNGTVTGPILVVDLYELDFYSSGTLKGISLGLVVTDAVEENGVRMEITPEKMETFLQVTGTRLVSYLRERFNEVTSSVPIMVAAYQLNTEDNGLSKGGYIYTEFFEGSRSTFHAISQETVLVPSTRFTELDADTAAQFTAFKNDVAVILADNTYVTGEALFQDGQVHELKLNVTTHGKTVGEIMAVVQSVREKLAVFTSTNASYKVIIKNNGDVCAILERPIHSTDVAVITTF